MGTSSTTPPVVLAALGEGASLVGVLDTAEWTVIEVHTGTIALECARDALPDVIVLAAELPDMTGLEACRMLHGDLRIGHHVPILVLAGGTPSPEERVAALRAGAWDFLRYPDDAAQFSLKLQTYVQAKRNLDVALAEGPIDPVTGVHSRPVLARRARELGALMARRHGALACLVFSVGIDRGDMPIGGALVRAARLSDVVGALSPTQLALVAPGTDPAGVIGLARRVGSLLQESVGDGTVLVPGATLFAGYDAVVNLRYSPVDPAELLAHAAMAVRHGIAEPGCPWLRRHEGAPAPPRVSDATGRAFSGEFAIEGRADG